MGLCDVQRMVVDSSEWRSEDGCCERRKALETTNLIRHWTQGWLKATSLEAGAKRVTMMAFNEEALSMEASHCLQGNRNE